MEESATVSTNEHKVFEFIAAHKGLDFGATENQFRTEINIVDDCAAYQTFFKSCWTQFNCLKEKHGKKGNAFIVQQGRSDAHHFDKAPTVEPRAEKERRKSFPDLSDRAKKMRTDELLKYIDDRAQREFPELSTTQLLGYLIHRINLQSNKSVARVGHELFQESATSLLSFSNEEAVALMHSLTLSRDQMRKMRHLLATKGIHFPTSNELLEARKKLRPVITSVLDGRGVQVQYKELVQMTVESVLKVAMKEKNIDFRSGELEMTFKDGGDGAGQQVVWNSKEMLESKENMFQYGITPLKLVLRNKETVETLWINHTPNSCRTLRPLFLIRESETDEDLLNLVIPTTDKARSELKEEGVCVKYQEDNAVNVKVTIHDSMKDLKFKRHISGLGGADCILCISQTKDWTDREKVSAGFPIERSAEETWKLYEQLVNEEGDVPTKAGDFEVRQGLTKKPLTTSDQTNICITHSYINVTTWFLKVLYRCHIDYKNWVEKSGPLGEPIRQSRERVLGAILHATGLYLDQCNKANGKGGTSTDGNQGRRFFSEEVLGVISDLLSGHSSIKHQENILLLHRQLSTILSVVSSTQKVDLTKLKDLCDRATYNIIDNFPWIRINHTLHGTLHHSVELISLNDGHGLGGLSEECLEANNKDIRNYLQFLSRKISPIAQLTDVMCRLLERSDPVICQLSARIQHPKYCTECGATDHTIRSHARLFNLPKKWYCSLVEDILLN